VSNEKSCSIFHIESTNEPNEPHDPSNIKLSPNREILFELVKNKGTNYHNLRTKETINSKILFAIKTFTKDDSVIGLKGEGLHLIKLETIK
jgi:hypothetical protein